MPEKDSSNVEYRGYTFTIIERSPGWRVYIYPGRHGLSHTRPNEVSGATREDALAKARAAVDYHLLG